MRKTKSCIHLQHALYFGPDEIRACSQRFFYKGKMKGDASLIEVQEHSLINYEQIIEAKKELIRKINANEESQCKGCPQIKSQDWDPIEKAELKTLSVENHSLCNMKCTYCSPLYFGGVKPKYDILQAIDGAKVSDRDLFVAWGGGEPTARRDFDDLLDAFNSHFCPSNQRIFTNALLYSSVIQRLVDENHASITTSVDAGTEETFKRVRKTRGLQKVIENLKKYATVNPQLVTIKYILTEDNLTLPELDEFVCLVEEAGLLKCHFLVSTDFKNEQMSDDMLHSGLYLYCRLFEKGVRALNMDDHFFNRTQGNESLISCLHSLSNGKNRIGGWVDEVLQLFKSKNSSKLVIWGTGQQAEALIRRIMKQGQLEWEIECVVDTNSERWGQSFLSFEIKSPDEITDDCDILIGSSNYYGEIYGHILEKNISPQRILPNIMF